MTRVESANRLASTLATRDRAREIRAADSSIARHRRWTHGRIPVLVWALRRDTVEVPSGRYPAVLCVRPPRSSATATCGPFLAPNPLADLRGATMEATELREQLCGAITRRSLVMFEYGDLIRVVEPHRFGVNSAGHEMLSGWLRAGYSRSDPAGGWRNYLLSDVSALQVLDAPFAGTRPGYAAHDQRMREVYCELAPSNDDVAVEGPFVVREPSPVTAEIPEATAEPVRHPPEEARTRDGEVDPPPPAP